MENDDKNDVQDVIFPVPTGAWGTVTHMGIIDISERDDTPETTEQRLAALASIRKTFAKYLKQYYSDNAESKTDTEFAAWIAEFLYDMEQSLYERGGDN